MRLPNQRLVLESCLLAVLSGLAGCGDGGGSQTPDTDVVPGDVLGDDVREPSQTVIEYTLFDTTKVVEGDALKSLTAVGGDGTLTVAAGSSWGDNLAAGQVLVMGIGEQTPYGLLREVVAVNGNGTGADVQTKAVPIQKAFRSLDVQFQKPLIVTATNMQWNDLAPRVLLFPDYGPGAMGKADSVDGYFGPFTVEWYPFNGDEDTSTPEDQVRVAATVGGGISFFYGMKFDWPEVWEGDWLPEITVGFSVHAGAEAHLEAEGVAAKTFNEDFLLGTANLEPFAIGPLVFFPAVELWANLQGGASSRYTFSAGANASFDAGITYSTDDGGEFTPPTPNFDTEPVVATAMEQAYAKASIGPRLKLALYGIFGPYAEVSAYTEINATSDQDPCWKVHGGFEGEIGLELELWGASLAEWGYPFNIFDMTFAEGTCQDDPATTEVPDVTEPEFTPWNKLLGDVLHSWEPDRGRTFIEQTVDGHYLVGGTGYSALSKVSREGDLFWSREYTRDEAVLPTPQRITAAAAMPDMGFVAAGHTPLDVLKLTNNGLVQWSKRPNLEYQASYGAAGFLPMSDGSFVLAAPIVLEDMGAQDVWVTRVAADGTPIWSKRWGTEGRVEYPTALVRFHDDIVVVGRTFSVDQDPADRSFALRLTQQGDLVWERELAGCDSFNGIRLQAGLESMDGDLILGGSYGLGGPQEVLIKVKPDGTLGWANVNSVSFLGIDLTGMFQLTDGGYLAVGTWWTASQDDWWIARMDSVGQMFWLKRLGDGTGSGVPSVALTGQGGALAVAVTGAGAVENTGSLWVSRFPVKTGELTLTAPATSVDETFTLSQSMCVSVVEPAASLLFDYPVTWTDDPVTASSLLPEWTLF